MAEVSSTAGRRDLAAEPIEPSCLEEIVRGVFLMTLEFECDPAPETELRADVRSVVGISGAWSGDVAVDLPRSLAIMAAARMFDVDEKTVSDADILDAVGELSNQIAGSVKSVLPPPCALGLPRPVLLTEGPEGVPVGATRYSFRGQRESFSVVLSLNVGDTDGLAWTESR